MDKLIQERIQKLVQDTDLFEYHNVTLGNMRIIDRGAPPYCVIYPGGFDQPRLQFSGNTLHQPVWTYPVDIVERFLDDDYTPIVDARQVFMDQMNLYPTLDGLQSVTNARVTRGDPPRYLFPQDGGEIPTFVLMRLEIAVTVIS